MTKSLSKGRSIGSEPANVLLLKVNRVKGSTGSKEGRSLGHFFWEIVAIDIKKILVFIQFFFILVPILFYFLNET